MNVSFIPNYSIYKNYSTTPFCGNRGEVNINKVNNRLVDIRKNNFINGIYDNDFFQKSDNYESNRINSYMEDDSLKNYDSELYTKPKDGGAPYKFAAIVKKMEQNGEDTNLVRKTPKIFEGMNKKEVFDTLNTLSYVIRDEQLKETSVKIGGKNISVDYVGKGCNSMVYKLDDNDGNVVAMKTYINPENISSLSMFGELAVYQGLKDRKINNIPELYLANPISMKVEDKAKEFEPIEDVDDIDEIKDYDGYKGGWTVVEFITPETPKKEGGEPLHDWLKEKQLYHIDILGNLIGNYIVDVGGIGI